MKDPKADNQLSSVDHVWSKLSFKNYARKRFRRRKNIFEDKGMLQCFENELAALKRLSHRHLVRVIGSYTDPTSVAILIEPVADCNLMHYLSQPMHFLQNQLPSIRSYFGCLANAMAYLHGQKIRHRDLKPENILLHQDRLFLTDFGASLDWSKRGHSTTLNDSVPRTWRYVAPEVAEDAPRNSASDMWSLGIVFLEMTTVLRGSTIRQLRKFLEKNGTGHPYVGKNSPATHKWFEVLRQADIQQESDNEPLSWIHDLLLRDPLNRPRAKTLLAQIQGSISAGSFCGFCCAQDGNETNSICSSATSSLRRGSSGDTKSALKTPLFEPLGPRSINPYGQGSGPVERWLDSTYYETDIPLSGLYTLPGTYPEDEIEFSAPAITAYNVAVGAPHPQSDETKVISQSDTVDEGSKFGSVEVGSHEEESGQEDRRYVVQEDSSASEATMRTLDLDLDLIQAGNSEKQVNAIKEDITSETPLNMQVVRARPILKNISSVSKDTLGGQSESSNKILQLTSANLADHMSTTAEVSAAPGKIGSRPAPKKADQNRPLIAKALLGIGPRAQTQQNTRNQKDQTKDTKQLSRPAPRISASVYMEEVWRAASTVPTSVMSANTRSKLNMGNALLKWHDRSYGLLEAYSRKGQASAVEKLLIAGCNPGTKEKPRAQPLLRAIHGGSQRHSKCAKILLEYGADVNVLGRMNKTPLQFAIQHRDFHGYSDLIYLLLQSGADPNLHDQNGDYPLLQILYGGYEPLEKHRRDALALLLQQCYGTNVNITPPGTLNMPIHLAVRRKDPWAVGMLLTTGAQVNQPNGSGATPLILAANSWTVSNGRETEQTEVLQQLLHHGAHVNDQDETGSTALHHAVLNGQKDMVELILEYGGDPYLEDRTGKLPCKMAATNASKISPANHAAIMRRLFEKMKISVPMKDGECPIVTAVKENNLSVATVLLQSGANANHRIKISLDQDESLVKWAMDHGDNGMVTLLVNHGARTT